MISELVWQKPIKIVWTKVPTDSMQTTQSLQKSGDDHDTASSQGVLNETHMLLCLGHHNRNSFCFPLHLTQKTVKNITSTSSLVTPVVCQHHQGQENIILRLNQKQNKGNRPPITFLFRFLRHGLNKVVIFPFPDRLQLLTNRFSYEVLFPRFFAFLNDSLFIILRFWISFVFPPLCFGTFFCEHHERLSHCNGH